MSEDMEQLYAERYNRYVTALRNGKADRVPIRPFAAEFTAKYAGYTCQEVTHDYEKAFAAARKCAADFDWDAAVANMVYVWTGLTQAIGLTYYAAPGIDIPADTPFQYLEPPEHEAHMLPEEYDRLIENPTEFLFDVWLPRVTRDVCPMGQATSYRNNLSFLRGGMAMLSYFNAFGPAVEALRKECGTVSAIAGILKAPLDILGDKLRGYTGLAMDLVERPDVVLKACQALAPHIFHVALASSDPAGVAPIGFWMHRGCVPFVSPEQFDTIYWPTLKPIIEELWANGKQTLFYAEGDWNAHLAAFTELPDQSIVYHVDKADIFEAHRALGKKFCISGGVPNYLLAYGAPEDVEARCKEVIDGVASEGGYIMDASAIIQNDAKAENIRAMTEFTRAYGAYSSQGPDEPPPAPEPPPIGEAGFRGLADLPEPTAKPGVCVPWTEERSRLPEDVSNEPLVKRVWEDVDALAYTYVWQCLLSF